MPVRLKWSLYLTPFLMEILNILKFLNSWNSWGSWHSWHFLNSWNSWNNWIIEIILVIELLKLLKLMIIIQRGSNEVIANLVSQGLLFFLLHNLDAVFYEAIKEQDRDSKLWTLDQSEAKVVEPRGRNICATNRMPYKRSCISSSFHWLTHSTARLVFPLYLIASKTLCCVLWWSCWPQGFWAL